MSLQACRSDTAGNYLGAIQRVLLGSSRDYSSLVGRDSRRGCYYLSMPEERMGGPCCVQVYKKAKEKKPDSGEKGHIKKH